MDGVSSERLLDLPVRLHGIQLGRPVDVVLEPATLRAVGLHVRCGDGGDRFLPLPAAEIGGDGIAVGSALMLLDEGNLGFYRSRGRTFRELRGCAVSRGRRLLGELDDLVLAPESGDALELVVARDGSRERIPYAADVHVGDGNRASAA